MKYRTKNPLVKGSSAFLCIFVHMKMNSHNDYIYRLIAEGEHQQQDFKFEISDARKIAKTLSAFSNTDGGRLLVGVKDNGRISGIKSDEEIYMIEAAAKLYCSPKIDFVAKEFIMEGRTILLIEIETSNEKPVFAKDENNRYLAYIRIKDENILATPIHLRVWEQERNDDGEWLEYTVKEQLLLESLQNEPQWSLNRYCRKTKTGRRAAENLLAKFIRYDIVETVFDEHKFYFRLK